MRHRADGGNLNMLARRVSSRQLGGYFFTLPATIYLAVFSILPLAFAIYFAFTSDETQQFHGARAFVGLANFATVLANGRFQEAALHTLLFASLSTALHVLLGLGVAMLFRQEVSRAFLAPARALFLLPWAISPVVVGIIFRLIYSSQFSFVAILVQRIAPQLMWQPLSSTKTALLAVAIANVWHFTPYFAINLLAGLQGIPKTLYEAAEVDGASPVQSFVHITLPSIRRLVLTIAFFDFVVSTVYFDLVWILTQGGPVWSSEVIVTHLYRKAFHQYSIGYAAAGGMALFLVLMAITFVVVQWMEREA